MALDSNQVVKLYITRLVNLLVPSEFGQEYTLSLTHDVVNRLITKTPGSLADFNAILDHYKSAFLSSGNSSKWVKFNSIVGTLVQLKSVDQVRSYLVFLGNLNGIDIKSNDRLMPMRSLPSPFPGRSSPGPVFQPHTPSMSPAPRVSTNGGPQIGQVGQTNGRNQVPMAQIIAPYYNTLDESTILQFLSYTLLGIDLKLFQFTFEGEDVYVTIPENINNSYSFLLGKIIEPALIYVKLEKLNSGLIENSPIKTSFLSLLKREMSGYQTFINDTFSNECDSLMKLVNILNPRTLRLRLFYSLANQLHLSGYEFLQNMYELTKFGDIRISALAEEIFDNISIPYYEIIENWIIRGELVDTNNDFFVEFDTDADNFQDIIVYIPRKIPSFFATINKDLGFKVFQIGKILIFLNSYCKELNWINSYTTKYFKFVYQANAGLRTMKKSTINNLINQQYEELVNYLTFVVHGKYEMISHVNNMKKFLLMSSSDFIDSLITNGFELFNQPSNQLTSTQLSKVLVQSVNSCSIKSYNSDFQNRLDARILSLSHGNIGWQVFTIEYKIDDIPISNFLNYKTSTVEYLRMFNFLWKLKHLNHLLDLNYLESNHLRKTILKPYFNRRTIQSMKDSRISYVIGVFKSVCKMRFKIIKFLNLIQDYLFNEIESNYGNIIKTFYKKNIDSKLTLNPEFASLISNRDSLFLPDFNKIQTNVNEMNFEELIKMNLNYIKCFNFKILDSKALGRSGEAYVNQIYSILETIYSFISSNEEFNYASTEQVSLLNLDQYSMAEDNKLEESETKLRHNVERIRSIYVDFDARVQAVFKDMRSDLDLKELSRMW